MKVSKETIELQDKINKILEDNLTEEELDRVLKVVLSKSNADWDAEMEYIAPYYVLMGAGGENAMWVSTGVEPEEYIQLPDPNKEFRRRLGM